MFWELIAVFVVGLATAGVVMSARLLLKRLPKWTIPAAAGLAMLGFVVHTEYTWYTRTAARLPQGAIVVATASHTAFYKPWSYARPQIFQFVAMDKNNVRDNGDGSKSAILYFFERHLPVHTLAVRVDCRDPRLDFGDDINAHLLRLC